MRDGTSKPNQSTRRLRVAWPALRRVTGASRAPALRLATGRSTSFAESIRARYSGRSGSASRANLLYQPAYRWIFQQVLRRSSPTMPLRLALTLSSVHHTINSHPVTDQPGRRGLPPVRFPLALPGLAEPVSNGLASGPTTAGRGVGLTDIQPTHLAMLVHQASAPADHAGGSYQQQPASPPAISGVLAGAGRIKMAFEPALTERVSSRGQRVSTGRRAGRSATLPVHRVVHVPQAAATPGPDSVTDTSGRYPAILRHGDMTPNGFSSGMPHFGSPHAPGWAGDDITSNTSAGLAPHQVQRLADQVVQIIDDRVIARRERTGRV
jgi:hypothetical protein